MSIESKTKIPKPDSLRHSMKVPSRLLLGPGPSNLSDRVLQAMSLPLLGHLHPEFTKIMDEVKDGLRYLFQTNSRTVFCISGTGHAGMDAVLTNLLEPRDVILVAKNGIWGERAADMATRQDADVKIIEKSAGKAFDLEDFERGLITHHPKVVFVVHAESSTGVLQPIEGIGSLCHTYGALLVVDTVAALGGSPFFMDEWQVDVAYTGSQKVLSCPPSLAPVVLSEKAMKVIVNRKILPRSFYFDFNWLANYWGCDDGPRRYHHTGPITSIYALRESLAQVSEEGLENLWLRHSQCAKLLYEGLQKLDLTLFVKDPKLRTPTITTVNVPSGIQWKNISDYLMKNYQVEMSGGLGPTAGIVWRIGLMGENCKVKNVELILKLLEESLSFKNLEGKNKL